MTTELETNDLAVDNATSMGEGATGQGQQDRQPKLDLTSLPEFREWQAAADRRAAAAEWQARQAQEAAQRLQDQYHRDQMSRLEGEDRLLYEKQLLQQQLAELNRQRELDIFAIQRQRDLEEIARETGVPISQIEGSANVHEAWRIGFKYQSQKATSKAQDPVEQRREQISLLADDRVDLTNSKGQGVQAALQSEYDRALADYDLSKMLEVMVKADRARVKIKE